MKMELGAQTVTVRDDMQTTWDFREAMKRIATSRAAGELLTSRWARRELPTRSSNSFTLPRGRLKSCPWSAIDLAELGTDVRQALGQDLLAASARASLARVDLEDDVTVETSHGKAIQQLEGFLVALARQQVLVL